MAKNPLSVDNKAVMSTTRRIVGSQSVVESWGPAMKESGLEYVSFDRADEALRAKGDCFVVDTRDQAWLDVLPKLKSSTSAPILSLIPNSVQRSELMDLRSKGVEGYLADNTPAEEVALRIRAILNEEPKTVRDFRAAKRVWFQQQVEFLVFNKKYSAWSTTLSETGIFLRTNLSFPLYTVIHLKFHFFGDLRAFECDGVIVRQEVEGDIRGLGVMFQNLKGENIRALESFLEIYR